MHNANTGVTMEFKYNQNGIRTQKVKKVNGSVTETTDYILKGKLIAAMKKNTDTYYFTYDASSVPATVNFNGANYTYIKNLQNDIVGILDAFGNLVVEYKYDAWGDAVSIYSASTTVDSLAFDNPFRYRGYVWDDDTGLYYLRARYYNPAIGRFVNTDTLLSWKKRLLTHNTFAYCGNAPSMNFDPNGKSFLTISALCAVLAIMAGCLSGCSKETLETLKSAPNLNRETAPSASYNCCGNGYGKQIVTNPTGYIPGMSTRETFNLVKADIGEDNITEHNSIDEEIDEDEYMVAIKCGLNDYHFIVYDNGTVYNKQGQTDMVIGCTIACINSKVWYPHFHTDEQISKYSQALERNEICYDDVETIFFSVKRSWSD